jgi:hypothetical protein
VEPVTAVVRLENQSSFPSRDISIGTSQRLADLVQPPVAGRGGHRFMDMPSNQLVPICLPVPSSCEDRVSDVVLCRLERELVRVSKQSYRTNQCSLGRPVQGSHFVSCLRSSWKPIWSGRRERSQQFGERLVYLAMLTHCDANNASSNQWPTPRSSTVSIGVVLLDTRTRNVCL